MHNKSSPVLTTTAVFRSLSLLSVIHQMGSAAVREGQRQVIRSMIFREDIGPGTLEAGDVSRIHWEHQVHLRVGLELVKLPSMVAGKGLGILMSTVCLLWSQVTLQGARVCPDFQCVELAHEPLSCLSPSQGPSFSF